MTFPNFTLRSLCPLREELLTLLVLTILCIPTYATTWIVQHEPGGHFVRVQDAIDGSSHGDTILVEPGIYSENINFNGKNVVLTSRYLFTEDEYYINNTILDGNNAGRVVTIENGESRAAQLIGFTIQQGLLTSPDGAYVYGAGIFIKSSGPSILSCTIKQNRAPNAGIAAGVAVHYYSAPFLSDLSIHDNWSSISGGGIGIAGFETNPEFDPVNKCSIYNNYAGYQNDISLGENYPRQLDIPLDTFSVGTPDDHFTGLAETVTLTIQTSYYSQLSHDLYVSPTGSDLNSGFSFAEPLKTIQHALAIIRGDSLNPRIIFLAEGVFAPSIGQHFPLNLKSYISVRGAGKELTILDGENLNSLITARYDNYYTVSDMSLIRAAPDGVNLAVTITENIGAVYSHMRFIENTGGVFRMGQYGSAELPHPHNSSIVLDNLEIINNTCRWTAFLGSHKTAILKNSIIRNSMTTYEPILDEYLNYPLQIWPTYYLEGDQTTILQNVEITQNVNMDADYPEAAMAIFVDSTPLKMIKCTVADNSSIGGGAIVLWDAQAIIVNSILYNNSPRQVWLYNPWGGNENTVIVKNSIVQDAVWGINMVGQNYIEWLDNNLDADPWFQGGDLNPYHLTENSPAIDAGTDIFVWEGDTIVNMSPDEYSGLAPDIGAYEYHEPDGIVDQIIPAGFELYPNFPNPFNGSTRISFSIPFQSDVGFTTYNIKGQQVKHQSFESLEAGTHRINWEAGNLSSGLYLYEVEMGDVILSGKALLVK